MRYFVGFLNLQFHEKFTLSLKISEKFHGPYCTALAIQILYNFIIKQMYHHSSVITLTINKYTYGRHKSCCIHTFSFRLFWNSPFTGLLNRATQKTKLVKSSQSKMKLNALKLTENRRFHRISW